MCASRRRNSTTEHGHAVSTRGYQSDPWSEERPYRRAPRSPPHFNNKKDEQLALTKIAPYQESARQSRAGLLHWQPDRNETAFVPEIGASRGSAAQAPRIPGVPPRALDSP